MKTISKNHFERLSLEAEEAEILEKEVIAKNLTKQLVKRASAVREDDESFSYDEESFIEDIQESIWDIIVNTSNFYGVNIDSEKGQEIVDFFSEKIIDDIKNIGNISSSVGAYEPSVPGEKREFPILEIEEE
jgi:hypothetical protein